MTSMKKLSGFPSLDRSEMLVPSERRGQLWRWFIAGTLLNLCITAALVGLTTFYFSTELQSVRVQMESHGERLALLEKIPLPTSHNDVPGALDELLSRQRRRRDAASSMDYGYGPGVRDDSNASSALVPNSDRPLMTRPCRDGRDGRDGMDGRDGRQGDSGVAGPPGEKGETGLQGEAGPRGMKGDPGDIGSPDTSTNPAGGPTYIRWGRTTCPEHEGTEFVYQGFGSGAASTHKGGSSDFLCIPSTPDWADTFNDAGNSHSYLYGMEYEVASFDPFSHENAEFINQRDVPCAVCRLTNRGTHLLIPAKRECPQNWTQEYQGFLMSGLYSSEQRSQAVCVDEAPEVIPSSQASSAGALLYIMEIQCGSIPCPPYVQLREVTCTVCSV
ncbi:short-chain collagen C4-like [Asterias rubens]|uniref:short-chain collagen C4-like n=1 Tax=Asterias rubens TaxID=7604 RepID=UPI00145509A1|nr:short-chain collagen C4-like [Asterias rubens]